MGAKPTTVDTVAFERGMTDLMGNYNQEPTEDANLRKRLLFRSRNLGMKELDLLVYKWANEHLQHMNRAQMIEFDEQVLKNETPDLYKSLVEVAEHNLHDPREYIQSIRKFSQRPDWNVQLK
jgi:succinate dehydrogenase flavin-adding protein (antitoxin of CptAB toxin-antitoxin module)